NSAWTTGTRRLSALSSPLPHATSSVVTSGRESGMAQVYACFRAFLVLTRFFRLQTRGGTRDDQDNAEDDSRCGSDGGGYSLLVARGRQRTTRDDYRSILDERFSCARARSRSPRDRRRDRSCRAIEDLSWAR